MAHGKIYIYIRYAHSPEWGLLEELEYEDASRDRWRRYARRVDEALSRVFGWQDRYYRMADASFAVEEQADQYSPRVHLFGARRLLPVVKRKKGGLKRKTPHWLEEAPPEMPVYKMGGGLKRKPFVPPVEVSLSKPPKERKKAGKEKRPSKEERAASRERQKAARRWARQQRRNWKLKDKGKALP